MGKVIPNTSQLLNRLHRSERKHHADETEDQSQWDGDQRSQAQHCGAILPMKSKINRAIRTILEDHYAGRVVDKEGCANKHLSDIGS